MNEIPVGKRPGFLIIGAQKCGTTALARSLKLHDDVVMSEAEVHFFSHPKNYAKGLEWYAEHFPESDLLKGEKTPDYLNSVLAPARIAEVLPKVKLLILLRDPVDRAYSQWNHMMQNIDRSSKRGWELVSFEEAIDRANAGVNPFGRLLTTGHYMEQILRFVEHFPPEQIHIGLQERLYHNGAEEFARITNFLEVSPPSREPKRVHVRTYESPMCPHMDAELTRYFAPHNRRLYEFLGGEIPEWRKF
jgi:hypothetical protein